MSYFNQGSGYGNSGGGYSSQSYGQGSSYTNPMENYFQEMSKLEKITAYTQKSASIEAKREKIPVYTSTKGAYLINKIPAEHMFLNPDRPLTREISTENEIMQYVKQAFKKTTGKEFSTDFIKITILNEKDFRKLHEDNKGIWSPGLQGFAINRNRKGINEIFVKQERLDSLMLTIGHEIGHIMSPTLRNSTDEEAKAFAFSMEWMRAIKDNNIAGIAQCINPNPAKNGLHDKAFEFVIELIQEGKVAMQIFEELSKGKISISKKLEVVCLQ